MKKMLTRAMMLLIVVAMVLSCGSCAKAGGGANDGDTKGELPEGLGELSAELQEALMNSGKIQVYCFDGVSELDKAVFNEFGTKYGGEVDARIISWEGWQDVFFTHYAANDAPDLIYVFEKLWPKVGNRGMLYTTNELKAKGVLGLDHFLITDNEETTKRAFSFKGEQYAFTFKTIDPGFIFVNESMFEEHEVKSPSAYYAEGNWNWDTFLKAAREITGDWDGDGNTDTVGYYGWDTDYFVLANGGQLISLEEDGTLVNTMDSLNTKNGLDYARNLYNVERVGTTDKNAGEDKVAMRGWLATNICTQDIPGSQVDWSIVPFPTGPDASGVVVPGIIDGWGCVSSSENPQGVINYIICQKMYRYDGSTGESYATWKEKLGDKAYANGKTMLETVVEYQKFTTAPIYQGVGSLYNSQWGFWNTVRGTSQTTQEIISANRSMFDAQIEAENNASVK